MWLASLLLLWACLPSLLPGFPAVTAYILYYKPKQLCLFQVAYVRQVYHISEEVPTPSIRDQSRTWPVCKQPGILKRRGLGRQRTEERETKTKIKIKQPFRNCRLSKYGYIPSNLQEASIIKYPIGIFLMAKRAININIKWKLMAQQIKTKHFCRIHL